MSTSKLFIIDDDVSTCKALGRMLLASGFKVETFNSPRSFLDSVLPEQEGCLILDIHMPEEDGIRFLKRLKNLGYCMPMILMTGEPDLKTRELALGKGVVGFLQKPFQEESVLELIGRALETAAKS